MSDIIIKLAPDELPPVLVERINVCSKKELIEVIISGFQKMDRIASQAKGQEGEDLIEEALRSEFNLVNTSKKGFCGDFIFKVLDKVFMLEIKNYSYPIQKKEVVKFKRDLLLSKYSGALFLSLNTKIVGYSDFEFISDFEGTDIPVIFLVSSDLSFIKSAIYLLIKYATFKSKIVRDISDDITPILSSLLMLRKNIEYSQQLLMSNMQQLIVESLKIEQSIASILAPHNESTKLLSEESPELLSKEPAESSSKESAKLLSKEPAESSSKEPKKKSANARADALLEKCVATSVVKTFQDLSSKCPDYRVKKNSIIFSDTTLHVCKHYYIIKTPESEKKLLT